MDRRVALSRLWAFYQIKDKMGRCCTLVGKASRIADRRNIFAGSYREIAAAVTILCRGCTASQYPNRSPFAIGQEAVSLWNHHHGADVRQLLGPVMPTSGAHSTCCAPLSLPSLCVVLLLLCLYHPLSNKLQTHTFLLRGHSVCTGRGSV